MSETDERYWPEGYDPKRFDLPPEVFTEIVELIKQGFSTIEISEECGWSRGTIRKIQRAANVGRTAKIWSYPTDEIAQAYIDGDKVMDIQHKFEINPSTLYKILKAVGVPTRKYDPFIQEGREMQLDVACQMYEAGHPIYNIEIESGVSQVSLHKELRKRGIQFRRPR